jgi:hypothetical protein
MRENASDSPRRVVCACDDTEPQTKRGFRRDARERPRVANQKKMDLLKKLDSYANRVPAELHSNASGTARRAGNHTVRVNIMTGIHFLGCKCCGTSTDTTS